MMADEWYVKIGAKVFGPHSTDKLRSGIEQGKLKPGMLVRCGADGDWREAHRIEGLVRNGRLSDSASGDSVVPDTDVDEILKLNLAEDREYRRELQIAESPSRSGSQSKLRDCPDCGHQVSKQAASCPRCGCPLTALAEPLGSEHGYGQFDGPITLGPAVTRPSRQAERVGPGIALSTYLAGLSLGLLVIICLWFVVSFEAVTEPAQLVDATPSSGVALEAKANAAFEKGDFAGRERKDYDTAVLHFTDAIRLFEQLGSWPAKLADAYNGRGHAYKGRGENEKAIADFTEAIRLGGSELSVKAYHLNRSWVYRAQGEVAKADADWVAGGGNPAAVGGRAVPPGPKRNYAAAIIRLESTLRDLNREIGSLEERSKELDKAPASEFDPLGNVKAMQNISLRLFRLGLRRGEIESELDDLRIRQTEE